MSQGDTLIAVIGVTGAGKSTFINKATGRNDMKIGNSLNSCTSKVETTRFRIDNRWVTLIDTPGFDDTELDDTDILRMIADFLASTYKHQMFLTGIVFLQGINSNRVTGSERTRTRLFEKVCGPGAYSNIVIGTTMWNQISSQADGDKRMQERKSDPKFWGAMVAQGTRVVKHNNTSESARDILRMLINKNTVRLQMQQELVDKRGDVVDTSAGKFLDAELGRTSERYQARIHDLEKDRRHADEVYDLRVKLEQVQVEKQKLRSAKVSFLLELGLLGFDLGLRVLRRLRGAF
ncbi:P-loop containing nucleoside triphosphate hydrolase protein [Phaeosphaeria sp. MPI-PUGE-AT-0046c]|nr:P-loop containing nucleoside triphosphate hydrolase protein [Phaeosphaeria sp. MPI-PUGE-AT-0046c]